MSREFILNLHGYKGTDKNSLYKALVRNNYNVVSPYLNYKSMSSEQVIQELKEIIEKQKAEGYAFQGVSGSSLGGFYALCISAVYKVPALLVNPAMFPELILPKLGFKCDMESFLKVRVILADYDPSIVTCVIGDKDDIISDPLMKSYVNEIFSEKRTVHVPDGRHSGSTLPLSAIIRSRAVF